MTYDPRSEAYGANDVLSAIQLRELKHQLRTPINHIIGFSELLRDTAEDLSAEAMDIQALAIRDLGSEIQRLLEQGIGLLSSHADLDGLDRTLAPSLQLIELRCRPLEQYQAMSEYLSDLNRIEIATKELRTLLRRKGSST